MTKDELNIVMKALELLSDPVIAVAKLIIQRELSCNCVKSGNPSCSIHGISAQLKRSQAE